MPGQSDSIPSWPKERVSEPTKRRPRLRRVHFFSLGTVIVAIVIAVVAIISGHKTGTAAPPLPQVGTQVVGTVTSVSSTSITIQVGQVTTETATVTKSTEFLGQAQSISSVKVGDHIGAALTQEGGKQYAYALEDPSGMPAQAIGTDDSRMS